MKISGFDDLLNAARQQTEPHRLLFVFTNAELPDDCTAEQRTNFDANQGGTLTPVMCVDKSPDDLRDFADLERESRAPGHDWRIVFAAALPGHAGQAPTNAAVEQSLQSMVAGIKAGVLGSYIPFDRTGNIVTISQ